MLHRRQPGVAIVGRRRAVERDVLRVHRHAQHRHVVLPADHRADSPVWTVDHRQRRAVAEAPDHPLHRRRHELAVLAEQRAVRAEEQRRAVAGAELALMNPADHDAHAAMLAAAWASALSMRAGDLQVSPCSKIHAEFVAAQPPITRAIHQPVIHALRTVARDVTPPGRAIHICARHSRFSNQPHRLVDAERARLEAEIKLRPGYHRHLNRLCGRSA